PAKYIALYPKKVLNWFNVNPGLATVGQQKQAQVVLLTVSYAVLLGFVGLRLWQTRWKPLEPHESLALLLYIAAAMIYAIFFTRVRFRVPFDLLLLVPAAQAASELIKKYVYPGKEKSQG